MSTHLIRSFVSNKKDVYAGLSTSVTTSFAVFYVQQIWNPIQLRCDNILCWDQELLRAVEEMLHSLAGLATLHTPMLLFPSATLSTNQVHIRRKKKKENNMCS